MHAIDDAQKACIGQSTAVALYYRDVLVGVLDNIEIYEHRKEERVARQFGTTDVRHPTIELIMAQGNWLIGGDLKVRTFLQ